MIQVLVNVLDSAAEVISIATRKGLVELKPNPTGGTMPMEFVGAGQFRPVGNDLQGSWSYWRLLNDGVTSEKADVFEACAGLRYTMRLRHVMYVDRDGPCGDITSALTAVANNVRANTKAMRTALRAASVTIQSASFVLGGVYASEFGKDGVDVPTGKSLVAIDFAVVVVGSEACILGCTDGEPFEVVFPAEPCPAVLLCTDGLEDGYVPTWNGSEWVGEAGGGGGGGTGDVTGPASSVSNNFASFNGITGKTIKDSGLNAASFDAAGSAAAAQAAAIAASAQRASNLSDLASASTARTNLGLGTLATQSGTFSGTSSGTNTGDQDLSGYQTIAALAGSVRAVALTGLSLATSQVIAATDSVIQAFGYLQAQITALTLTVGGKLTAASNLSDLASASTARTNLGLGTAAVVDTGTGATNVPTITDADARYAALNAPSFLTYSGGSQAYGVNTLAAVNSTTFTFPSTGLYHVQYAITHDANATTTGAVFGVAGTAVFDYLNFTVIYRVDTTTAGRTGYSAFSFFSAGATGLTASSSFATTNNRVSVDIWINVTTVGTVSLLAASEVVVANGITVTAVTGFMKKEA